MIWNDYTVFWMQIDSTKIITLRKVAIFQYTRKTTKRDSKYSCSHPYLLTHFYISWIKLKTVHYELWQKPFLESNDWRGKFQPLGHGSTLSPHTPVEVTRARHYERPLMSDVANNLLYIIFTNTSQLTIFTTAWLIVWCLISIQTSSKKSIFNMFVFRDA